MNSLITVLGEVPQAVSYAIVAAAVLAESVLFVGAFIPTLTLLLTAGALARSGQLNLLLLIAIASLAVVTGDFLAHRTGRALGPRLRTGRLGRRLPATAWQRAEALMARRGGHAVFWARFVPLIRTLTPHLAGATRLPYRRIAPYSLAAAPLWAALEAGAGFTAAASLQQALTLGGPVLAATCAVVATVGLWWKRHSRIAGTGPRGRRRVTPVPRRREGQRSPCSSTRPRVPRPAAGPAPAPPFRRPSHHPVPVSRSTATALDRPPSGQRPRHHTGRFDSNVPA
ncbi:VTT domain-containing protein [Streptomyces sp. NPDC039028]|uniref:DedA family protein n=1 Tax=unclassified Streptomyces TaxID=2593676 RepID=UPI003411F57F